MTYMPPNVSQMTDAERCQWLGHRRRGFNPDDGACDRCRPAKEHKQ